MDKPNSRHFLDGMKRLGTLAVSGAVALAACGTFVMSSEINTYGGARIEQMVDYTALPPFVTRALVPQSIRFADSLVRWVPDSTFESLRSVPCVGAMIDAFFKNYPPYRRRPIRLAVLAIAAIWACFFSAILWQKRLLMATLPGRPVAYLSTLAFLSPLFAVALTKGMGHLYDPATLALMTGGLALIAERAWRTYLLVFALACVNRETAIYLVPLFAVSAWFDTVLRPYLAIQIALWISIRGILEAGAFEFHSVRVWRVHPGVFGSFLPKTWPEAVIIAAIAAVWLLALAVATSQFLRASLLLLVPMVAAFLVMGGPHEYRTFIEFVPIFVTACALLAQASVQSFVGAPKTDGQ